MPATASSFPLLEWPGPIPAALLGAALALLAVFIGFRVRRRNGPTRVHQLLGRLGQRDGGVGLFLRGMFVPSAEFFSRSPEYPPGSSGTLTVQKWTGIPEVYAAGDVRAAAEVVGFLTSQIPSLTVSFRAIDRDRKGWGEDFVAIGSHFKSQQVLDTCEPRLVAFRNPDAFRSLVSPEVFEARGGADFGFLYKGTHPATHCACWVVMGLTEHSTEAAARFLRTHSPDLQRLVGSAPFAAVLAVEAAGGRPEATLAWLRPRPAWWRRLLHGKSLRRLSGTVPTGAG